MHTLSRDDQRLLGFVEQVDSLLHIHIALFDIVPAGHLHHTVKGSLKVVAVAELLDLGVLGNADEHRPRTAAAGDVESLRHYDGNVFRT